MDRGEWSAWLISVVLTAMTGIGMIVRGLIVYDGVIAAVGIVVVLRFRFSGGDTDATNAGRSASR
jgi:hypothetical protein